MRPKPGAIEKNNILTGFVLSGSRKVVRPPISDNTFHLNVNFIHAGETAVILFKEKPARDFNCDFARHPGP